MSDKTGNTFNDGDELMLHVASLGASTIPLSPQAVEETARMMMVELNMFDAIYRGEDDDYWIVDLLSVDPPLRDCRLRKDSVDVIGVKSQVGVVSQKLIS